MAGWIKLTIFATDFGAQQDSVPLADSTLTIMNRSATIIRILSTFALYAVFVAALPASAQTCRINCGRSGDGSILYKEVYEYDFVSEKPSFPGGDSRLVSFINKERRYPEHAYRKGIQGRVTCSFVVNVDGSISNITILKGVEPSLNKEALRIFSQMPEWIPGKLDGRPVPVRVIWPIPFRR